MSGLDLRVSSSSSVESEGGQRKPVIRRRNSRRSPKNGAGLNSPRASASEDLVSRSVLLSAESPEPSKSLDIPPDLDDAIDALSIQYSDGEYGSLPGGSSSDSLSDSSSSSDESESRNFYVPRRASDAAENDSGPPTLPPTPPLTSLSTRSMRNDFQEQLDQLPPDLLETIGRTANAERVAELEEKNGQLTFLVEQFERRVEQLQETIHGLKRKLREATSVDVPATPRPAKKAQHDHHAEAVQHLRLGECIGHGVTSRVFKALDTRSGTFVAVKQLDKDALDAEMLTQVRREVQVLTHLESHPNVVKFFEILEEDKMLYIVLEYVEAGSLSKILQKYGVFPENLTSLYVRQMLEGLDFLHQNGVLHQDIKVRHTLHRLCVPETDSPHSAPQVGQCNADETRGAETGRLGLGVSCRGCGDARSARVSVLAGP
jgi:Protein kinase domain